MDKKWKKTLGEKSGYIDEFSSLTDGSDGCNFMICIECGHILGFDLKKN